MSIIRENGARPPTENPTQAPASILPIDTEKNEAEQRKSDSMFVSELKGNTIETLFNMINMVSGKWVTFHSNEINTSFEKSPFLTNYFEKRLGKITRFLGEDARAGVIMFSKVAKNCTIGEIETDFSLDCSSSEECEILPDSMVEITIDDFD